MKLEQPITWDKAKAELVAAKHYLQLTDDHFTQAAQNAARPVAQKAAQQPSVTNRNVSQGEGASPEKHDTFANNDSDFQDIAKPCKNALMAPVGFEPTLDGF